MAIKMESTLLAHSRHRTSVLMIPADSKWIRSGFQISSASSLSDIETDMINFFFLSFLWVLATTDTPSSDIQLHSSYLRPLLAGECECSPWAWMTSFWWRFQSERRLHILRHQLKNQYRVIIWCFRFIGSFFTLRFFMTGCSDGSNQRAKGGWFEAKTHIVSLLR